jgi:hypothetical protein
MTVIPGVPPPSIPTPPALKPVGDSGTAWLKEIMIAALALITLTALLLVYWKLMSMPSNPIDEAMKAQTANVEKVGTALFGIFAAFVGYYAGRVPAERAAAAAQQEAQAERKVSQQKGTEVAHATALLASARDHLLGNGNALAAAVGNVGGNGGPAGLVGAIDAFINTRRSE